MSKLQFDPVSHSYHVGGRQAVSVTRVLEHSGLVDASHYATGGEDFLERGRVVHEATAEYCEKRFLATSNRQRTTADQKLAKLLEKLPERWRGFLTAWVRFLDETGFVSEAVERRVHCDDPLYAGTMDRLGQFPGFRLKTVLDIKNHNTGSVAQSVKYQLVAYGHALDPKRLFDRVGVALHPDGTYKLTRFKIGTYIEDCQTFLYAVSNVYDAQAFVDERRPRPSADAQIAAESPRDDWFDQMRRK
jgi:hypothetical protein